MFVNKRKINTSRFFSMLYHEESLKKPPYNMATTHFWTKPLPPFSSKNFHPTPSQFHQFWISWAPVLFELYGGFTLCMVPIRTLSPYDLISPITLSPILRISTIQPLEVMSPWKSLILCFVTNQQCKQNMCHVFLSIQWLVQFEWLNIDYYRYSKKNIMAPTT